MDKLNTLLKEILYSLTKDGNIIKLLAIAGGLYIIYKLIFRASLYIPFAIATIPLAIVLAVIILKYYHRLFYLLFASHFIILIISSYVDIRLGILTLLSNILVVFLLMMVSFYRSKNWKEGYNVMLLIYIILGVYYVAEIFNPNNVQEAWNIAIVFYLAYPIICAILVPITIRKTNHIIYLLILWSVFILFGALRGYIQKNYGFNSMDLRFLFEEGGASTHIIWSGIRYFSYFTDAANFGVHMAMATLIFGISLFSIKNIFLKSYFVFVIIAAIYGMGISGTRSSIAIPLGGLLFYVVLSGNWKRIATSIFILLAMFLFFRLTTIGDSNEYIRKMRSAFTPTTDASYNIRMINREKIKVHMKDKPFGYGLGLGAKAERFRPKELMPLPVDSWLVNVWTDTGIVGLILYIILHCILFAWCSWIIMFKLSNKRLRNLVVAWLCANAGFFFSAYTNDVMQYPNMIVVFTGFALCIAAPYIEKNEYNERQELI